MKIKRLMSLILMVAFVLQLCVSDLTVVAVQELLDENVSTEENSETEAYENIETNDILTYDLQQDFTYYIASQGEVNTCAATEINDIIANASSGTVFELNNDVMLDSTMLFSNSGIYTLELNGHRLTVAPTYRTLKVETDTTLTVKNGEISGAEASSASSARNRDGAGIYCSGTLYAENLTVANNNGRYGGGIYINGGTFVANQMTIDGNTGSTIGGAMYFGYDAKVELNDCTVSGNNFRSSGVGGAIYVVDSTLTANNSRVINNGKTSNVSNAGIYIIGESSNVMLNNCIIENCYAGKNSSAVAAGLALATGHLTLSNTVIRNNTGGYIGGLSVAQGTNLDTSIQMESGAVYNNIALNPYSSLYYANDILIKQSNFGMLSAKILAASTMNSNDGIDFSDYYWKHTTLDGSDEFYEELHTPIEINTATSESVYHLYNASNEKVHVVAEILRNDVLIGQFSTIADAIETASSGDTIRLISDEIINESVITNKSITIDLNERTWNSDSKALVIEGTTDVTIIGQGKISNIEHNGNSLVLNSNATIGEIYLGTDKFVQVGPEFSTSQISLVLSNDSHNLLQTQDIILIKDENNLLPEDIIEKVNISGVGPLVIVKKDANGNVVAHTAIGVFIDGENGDNGNDGLSVNSSVKTFEKAK